MNQQKHSRKTVLCCFIASLVALSLPAGATTVAKVPPTDIAARSSEAQLAATQCVIGEEKVVPGDYYYCLGQQSYGQQHYGYAKKFFTTAAGWASKPAQYVLGVMALNGDHQPVDRALALAWLNLASERRGSRFRSAYDQLNAVATKAEAESAAQWLVKLRPTYADATAANRAEQRYDQGMAQIKRIQATAGSYCMEGTIGLADSSGAQPDPAQCPSVQKAYNALNATAATLLDGWIGHVSVGPLLIVHVPPRVSKSTRRAGGAGISKSASNR